MTIAAWRKVEKGNNNCMHAYYAVEDGTIIAVTKKSFGKVVPLYSSLSLWGQLYQNIVKIVGKRHWTNG